MNAPPMSTPDPRANVEDVFELAPLQRGLLFHHLRDPAGGDYIEQMTFMLEGKLDREAFARAWQTTVDRHAALRTSFQWEGLEQPLQIVHRRVPVPVENLDWSGDTAAAQTTRMAQWLATDRKRGFALAQAPLLRLTLIALGAGRTQVVWTHSHLLLDGWSLPLVLRDVLAAYAGHTTGRAPAPKYRDFVRWLRGRNATAAENFWRTELAGFDEPTPLPCVDGATRGGASAPHEATVAFGPEETGTLKAWGAARGVTLATLTAAAWALVLAKRSGRADVVFGCTVAGRPAELPGADETVGLFINTLPLRVAVPAVERAGAWVAGVQTRLAAARTHEHTPLASVQAWSDVPAGRALFETLFVFENYPGAGEAATVLPEGLRLAEARSLERTHYPLTVVAAVDGGALVVRILSDGQRVGAAAAEEVAGFFRAAVGELMAADDATRVGELDLLTTAEGGQLARWSGMEPAAAADWVDTFLAHVRARPEADALRSAGGTMSYGELAERSAQLADRLATAGVGRETIVALGFGRSAEWPVAALAVLRAGGAYLPIDPAYPKDRIQFMLDDSGARVVIAPREHAAAMQGGGRTVLAWEDFSAKPESGGAGAQPLPATDARQAAYVIYTSGSTGRPKGVVVSRGAWAALAEFQREAARVGPGDRVLQFASTSFDASVWELSLALGSGATLVTATTEALRPGEPLAETLEREAVTCVLLPPSTAAHLPEGAGATVKLLIVGGEACRPGLVTRWANGTRRFVNAYGPTENAVVATWTDLAATDTHGPIGGPVTGTRVYVLDAAGARVPPGVAGELALGGASLARGYLGRPELTAERFGPDPYGAAPGARLYRTGDRVRWGADGRLEFLGRIDEQVKLRGFRVELGEIEAVLATHPAVKEAAVAVRGEAQLVAWVARRADATATAEVLRAWVQERLPEHMVPGRWCFVSALPLTPNGKVNKRALPEPESEADSGAGPTDDNAGAGSPLVALVAGIFGEVLGVPRVGAEADFFELGGHSLLATKLLSRLRESVAPGLPLRAVFEAPTPRALAEFGAAHRTGRTEAPPPITARAAGTAAPASFGQQRFWLLEKLTPGNAANHLQLAVHVSGTLDRERVVAALQGLRTRHEPLRTGLAEADGAVVQTDAGDAALPLRESEGADWATALAADAAVAFELARGPLWRVRVVRVAADEHVIGFTFHHAIFDGWSEGVLVRELAALYDGRTLPSSSITYGDYAAWQRAWLAGGELARQLGYWRTKLAGVPVLELPTDRPRPAVQTFAGGVVTATLATAEAGAVAAFARKESATLFMVLLAAWEAVLARHSGQTDFAVGTPIAGRTRRETEELIGLFLNTLVLRADTAGDPTFAELVARVRTTTLDAYAHQDAPFEQIVEVLNPPRDLSRTPLFQTLLVLQNSPAGEARVAGLTLEPLRAEATTAKYELTLGAMERDGRLELSLEFNRAIFDEGTARRILARYVTLLMAAVALPKRRITTLAFLPAEESAQLRSWNATARTYPTGTWVHEFPARAPAEAIAVVCGTERLTYAEFGTRVARLAARLRAGGVGRETLVGVYLERSVELVVALHAILHAGGAYVPLDPGYPRERVAHMLTDAGVAWVLTTTTLAGQIPPTTAQLLRLDVPATEEDATEPGRESPQGPLHGDSAAYMIYTSGSTGRPKGAVNTHAGILNRLQWMQEALPLGGDDRVLQKTPFSFDVSVWEFFWPLMTGATLVVAEPDAHKDPARLVALIVAQGITTLHFVPSMLRAFLEAPGVERCTSLRQVICSGEELPRELVERFYAKSAAALHNLYGPTEAAVDVTWHACRRGDTGPVPIGRPIANLEIMVLDTAGRETPIGVPGEVMLGGIGLGRGYHGQPGLTAERWVPHPTSAVPGARLYRTGDLGRWRADGEVEYLGRLDFQVKLRGFRIELGEIEAALREHSQIADAAVALRTDAPGEARLVGYVVARGAAPTIAELREWLARRLPEHMVPAAWVTLDALPLSPAGKTDRRALPAPAAATRATETAPPQGPVEEWIAAMWTELLDGAQPGRDDNFFVLGGHSLLATQFVSRVREQLQIELPLLQFFEDATPAGCARTFLALEPAAGHAEKYARARLRLRALSPEEKARLLAPKTGP